MRKNKVKLIDGNPPYRAAQEIGLHFLTLHTGVNEGAKVDMEKSKVERHACGTTMCHGGWYQWLTLTPRKHLKDYSEGGHKLAQSLGFRNRYELQNWADHNPKLWCNEEGDSMFTDPEAFGVNRDRSKYRTLISLERIGKHWLKVAARLEDLQTRDK